MNWIVCLGIPRSALSTAFDTEGLPQIPHRLNEKQRFRALTIRHAIHREQRRRLQSGDQKGFSLALTLNAVVTGSLPNHFFPDGRLAPKAGQPFAIIDQQLLRKVTGIAVRIREVPQRSTAMPDGALEDVAHGCGQCVVAQSRNSTGRPLRVNA